MENIDLTVLRALADWRSAGRRAALVTVVRTWGSSPRPPGSILALREDGAVVGSVSGGCVEDDLIDRFAQVPGAAADRAGSMPDGVPRLERYGVSAEEAHRFGLPCGGTLELLVEPDPDAGALRELVEALGEGRTVRREVSLASGAVSLHATDEPAELSLRDDALVCSFGPEYRMLLIGAGQLAEYLATMALFNGFSVSVCDPREEYRGHWQVAGVRIITEMPDDAVAAFKPDRRSCVVALTHDPKLDDLALMQALESEAFYVGGIGSRRNNANRRARMAEYFDIPPERLARLRGPIGLYIGSKTPPEIAVSVMAEILAVKNGVAVPREMEVGVAKQVLQAS